MTSSAMELQLGVFGILLTTHAETNANKIRPRSSRAVLRFSNYYAPDESRLFSSRGKTWIPPIGAHAGIKMAQVLGSLVYICDLSSSSLHMDRILQCIIISILQRLHVNNVLSSEGRKVITAEFDYRNSSSIHTGETCIVSSHFL